MEYGRSAVLSLQAVDPARRGARLLDDKRGSWRWRAPEGGSPGRRRRRFAAPGRQSAAPESLLSAYLRAFVSFALGVVSASRSPSTNWIPPSISFTRSGIM